MELEVAYQITEDEEGIDLEEKLTNLERELEEKLKQLKELKSFEKDYTLSYNIKND